MKYSLGLDIGSVNAKLAVVDAEKHIVHTDIGKITFGPRAAVNSLLSRAQQKGFLKDAASGGITGNGQGVVPANWGWKEYGTALSIASGLLQSHPDTTTIIQIGGQSSLVIELNDGLNQPWKVASNPLCAAGTGRFIEQQAYRLGIGLDDFSRIAMEHQGAAPRIAARCSVFAKTDLIHLQQKGAPLSAMLYALCESIARMIVTLKKGPFNTPVYFVGGVAANAAVTRALSEAVTERNGKPTQIIVPDNFLYTEAAGAALLATGAESKIALIPGADEVKKYYELPALGHNGESPSLSISLPQGAREVETTCYLGVDVGSTSTKAVIIDGSGNVQAKYYTMTSGRPVDAILEVFKNLLAAGAGKLDIKAAGVTGSGRYLVGSLIGADLVKNEITAQTRAAAEIDTDADIIEIGGQDSKLVLKRKGTVVDYQMNKACAAGTGSFIDELADMLGVSVKNGDFAKLCFEAPYTVDLGTRCAAFMGQAVASAQTDNLPLEVIAASLANSIARNYLTKVVAHRKLGRKVILTGAVFYNEAVVAAFKQQLPDHEIVVPPHKEVSGAIGAALLAKEQQSGKTHFKGFQQVIDRQLNLNTFVCDACENNCTITRMQVTGEKSTFYGSRCDKYDAAVGHTKQETLFDDREKLLLRELKETVDSKVKVGVPRALMVHDYAPLLIGFLNKLGVEVILSRRTTGSVMAKAVELSYTDSCFPLKLLNGHIESIKDSTDFILYPSFIRLGEKDGDNNQKYACPLVQASPFIARHVLDMKGKLLSPIVDLSRGNEEIIREFTEVAQKMGFNPNAGKSAILAGLKAQAQFEADRDSMGQKVLSDLKTSGNKGVVIFSRTYMSQDSGANLGIAEKLAQLGVVPIPIDFLPLKSVNPKDFSDRPYWSYEAKFIAAAHLVAQDPQLFGLVLTNFGCGPNSFMLGLIEDIMGNKPLGQVEIDEHAAEAGIVTRLEAFVDTIQGYSKPENETQPEKTYIRNSGFFKRSGKTFVIPRMSPHVDALSASMNAFGVKTVVLPEPDERNILYSNQVTTGAECLPFRVTLGDFVRFCRDNGSLNQYEGLMAGAYGPCRLGKYAGEHNRALQEMGYSLPVRASVSNNAYRDLDIGPGFPRFTLINVVAVDVLQRLLWRARPYEKQDGQADQIFKETLGKMCARISRRESLNGFLSAATHDFQSIIDATLPRRPLVGINGEIYLRTNSFSNSELVRACEQAGLEAMVAPVSEWIHYVTYRHLEDALKERNIKKVLNRTVNKVVVEHDGKVLMQQCTRLLSNHDEPIGKVIERSGHYLSPRCGGEAILSIGAGLEWLEKPQYAGVISVMPHGCMPGGIVASMSEKFSAMHGKPWISLTYDGFTETNNAAKITEFAELIRFRSN